MNTDFENGYFSEWETSEAVILIGNVQNYEMFGASCFRGFKTGTL